MRDLKEIHKARKIEEKDIYLFLEGRFIFENIPKILFEVVSMQMNEGDSLESTKREIKLEDIKKSFETSPHNNDEYDSCFLIKKIEGDLTRKLKHNKCLLLWNKALNTKDPNEKGKAFAEFVKEMMKDSELFEFETEKDWTIDRDSEIDLKYRYRGSDPLWTPCDGQISFECKNWKKNIDPQAIAYFGFKVNKTGSKRAFFFISGKFSNNVKNTVKEYRMQSEIIIGLISENEINQYLNGEKTVDKILEASIETSRNM